MTLQNRVDPLGVIQAVPERGTCMGNRGILHNDRQELIRYHRHKNWVICRLSFKERHRAVMSPHRYTELFFLDEATALAAGHRPCAECSRARYREFVHYWRLGNPDRLDEKMDNVLHQDRFRPYRRNMRTKKRVYTSPIDALPPGTFILLEPDPSTQPYLVLADSLRRWSFGGYGRPVARRTGVAVTVLTPRSMVNALAAGFRPQLHPETHL